MLAKKKRAMTCLNQIPIRNSKTWTALTLVVLCAAMCMEFKTVVAQDYPNSIVSTEFDFIHDSDPSAFVQLTYREKTLCEMPDKRPGTHELRQPAFVFGAQFNDGTSISLMIDANFKTKDAAQKEAMRYVPRLGKLPTTLRQGVRRLVVHQGGEDTTAFSDRGLIVIYSDNASKRISTHDLEETIFHESVHAAWDQKYADSDRWQKAQAQDGNFVTLYAKRKPKGEDLAESALFAYTLVHHPERIPAADAEKIKKAIPARIQFVAELIPPNKPIFYQVKAPVQTGGSQPPGSETVCRVDISQPGQLSDILSNALVRGLKKEETSVRKFLDVAQDNCSTGEQLFQKTATNFEINPAMLNKSVVEFLHCNCQHEEDSAGHKRNMKIINSWQTQTDAGEQ